MPDTVGRLLKETGYSLQAPARKNEGTWQPDRDAQFRYLDGQVEIHQVPEHLALPLRQVGLHPAERGPKGTFSGAICDNGNLCCHGHAEGAVRPRATCPRRERGRRARP